MGKVDAEKADHAGQRKAACIGVFVDCPAGELIGQCGEVFPQLLPLRQPLGLHRLQGGGFGQAAVADAGRGLPFDAGIEDEPDEEQPERIGNFTVGEGAVPFELFRNVKVRIMLRQPQVVQDHEGRPFARSRPLVELFV